MSISQFQYQVYLSFIVSFCLVGFSGVLLLRNSMRYKLPELAVFARKIGWLCCGLSFYGFLTSNLYVNYLRGGGALLPLAATVLVWVVAAPYTIIRLKGLGGVAARGGFGRCAIFCAFAYLCAALSAGSEQLVFRSLGFALVSCVIAAMCARFLWAEGRSASSNVKRQFYQVISCGNLGLPVLLLLRSLGLGDILAQLLLNVFLIVFALGLFLLCRWLNYRDTVLSGG